MEKVSVLEIISALILLSKDVIPSRPLRGRIGELDQ